MKVLVTGGAGYIGSHTVIELVDNGFDVLVADNLANSSRESLNRVEKITGKKINFYEIDLCKSDDLEYIFYKNKNIEAVIHFAGLKAVGESTEKPLLYYRNNLLSTLNLCQIMQKYQVHQLVFSSSATVYGDPEEIPIHETSPLSATNPYGRTKLFIEEMLRDLTVADSNLRVSLLRYFNPVGAHPSGLIGEDPNGIPNNLMPYISQVAVGKLDKLRVFGNDYDTPDGTGIRDYIHVVDLAKGHVAALKNMPEAGVCETYNLGTGKGHSVLEAINAFEKASGKSIPYEIVARRPGDIASCYADSTKAETDLRWKTEKTLEDACTDAWHWQSLNPSGYNS